MKKVNWVSPFFIMGMAFFPHVLCAQSTLELSVDVETTGPLSAVDRRLTFDRSFDAARPFEVNALSVVNHVLEERGENQLPRESEPLHLSSVFLGEGEDESDLSIFFRSASGGSSATHFYFVVTPAPPTLGDYIFDIQFQTSENGTVTINESPYLQDTISVTDDSLPSVEYIPTVTYKENPAE